MLIGPGYLKALGEDLFHAFVVKALAVALSPWLSLFSSCVTPVSACVVSCRSLLVCHLLVRTTAVLVTLTDYICNDTVSKYG